MKLSDFTGKSLLKHFHIQTIVTKILNFLSAKIKSLEVYLTLTFVLLMLVLIIFLAINGSKIFKLLQRVFASIKLQKKKAKTAEPVTMANPNTESPRMRRNQTHNNPQNVLNRTSSIFTVSGTEYDQKTVSTPISRHPAEDTLTSSVNTADFSYDNRALQLTPVGEDKPKNETNF